MNSNAHIVLGEVEEEILNAAVNALSATAEDASNFTKTFEGKTYGVTFIGAGKGKTGKNKSYYKRTNGTRKAYTGGWSDLTGKLANSIKATNPKARGTKLMADVFTDKKYAKYLEGKKGFDGRVYSVVSHIDKDFDTKGTFDKYLAEALQ